MTKRDLINKVAEREKITLREAEVVVNTLFETIKSGIVEGRGVDIRWFGTFSLHDRSGYLGKNPKTRQDIIVPPRHVPFFKPGQYFKNWMNLNNPRENHE